MSYDPTSGRWTQEDPIAFAGGDINLFRYVGNSSTNFTDPNGTDLQPPPPYGYPYTLGPDPPPRIPPPGPGSNLPRGGLFGGLEPLLRIPFLPNKKEILTGIPTIRPAPAPPGSKLISVPSGSNLVVPAIPPGTLVGPSGCGPCVGVILIPINLKYPTIVYHFGGEDNVVGSIPNPGPYYKAILNGAEQTGDKDIDNQSRITLEDVVNRLREWKVPIIGYVPSEGFHVGPDGKPYWTTPRGYPIKGYDPDYQPPPK